MQPEQKKKKKRITPELIAGPGSGAQAMGPQMGAPATVEAVKSKKQKTGSSTGYLRVKRAAEDQGYGAIWLPIRHEPAGPRLNRMR